jgi:hypothetical protein
MKCLAIGGTSSLAELATAVEALAFNGCPRLHTSAGGRSAAIASRA